MSWRFRRSVKILPGVRLNVSTRGLGVSAGPRGAKVSVNTQGEVRRTVGVPGTGLYHTTLSRLSNRGVDAAGQVAPDELTAEQLNYAKGRALRRVFGWGSALVIFLLALAGASTVIGWLIVPAIILTIFAPRFARFF
jgi:hypothetical protein